MRARIYININIFLIYFGVFLLKNIKYAVLKFNTILNTNKKEKHIYMYRSQRGD